MEKSIDKKANNEIKSVKINNNPKTKEEIEVLKQNANKICEAFKDFYRDNLELKSNEFEEFIKFNETELPIVFRINQMK